MLGEFIKALETCPDGAVFKEGFHDPHSYRGDYHQLGVDVYLAYKGCTSDKIITGWGAKSGEGFVLLTEQPNRW